MQYEAQSPAENLVQLEEDWRKDTLLQVRMVIQPLAPELDERIHYKMLGSGKKKTGSPFTSTRRRVMSAATPETSQRSIQTACCSRA